MPAGFKVRGKDRGIALVNRTESKDHNRILKGRLLMKVQNSHILQVSSYSLLHSNSLKRSPLCQYQEDVHSDTSGYSEERDTTVQQCTQLS